MQPIDHFEVGIEIDPLQRRHPRLENLEPADRAIMTPLPRHLETRGPGRADAPDEHQPGIAPRRHLDRQLPFADFTRQNHLRLAPSHHEVITRYTISQHAYKAHPR